MKNKKSTIKNIVFYSVIIILSANNQSSGFEYSSSFSQIQLLGLPNSISFQLKTGLISTSFADCFAQAVSSGVISETRFLEAKKPVDIKKIEEYVDQQYGAIPDGERKKLKELLINAQATDEKLKGKMNNPNLNDNEIILYSQERERLLKKLWEYESDLLNKYSESFKPSKYRQSVEELSNIEHSQNEAIYCLAAQECLESDEEILKEIEILGQKKGTIVIELIQAPTEPHTSNNTQSYINSIVKSKEHFLNYLTNLYSKGEKPQ